MMQISIGMIFASILVFEAGKYELYCKQFNDKV